MGSGTVATQKRRSSVPNGRGGTGRPGRHENASTPPPEAAYATFAAYLETERPEHPRQVAIARQIRAAAHERETHLRAWQAQLAWELKWKQ